MPRIRKEETPRDISPWARRIKALRREHKLTQAYVAEMLHLSQRIYADYELGNVRMPVDQLVKLAYFYNVSIDYICSAVEDPEPFPELRQDSELYSVISSGSES